jgi:flagellar basal-body rod protein FlgB
MDLLNSSSFRILEKSMDAAALRQKVIANNIANVDTPFFKKSRVVFEDILRQQMISQNQAAFRGYRTHERHFAIPGGNLQPLEPQIVQDQSTLMNNNLNNVDIDYEMALLSKNVLRYNLLTSQVNHEIGMLRTAIGGRV